jgi:O-antigen/teichoic acid export membrane protein
VSASAESVDLARAFRRGFATTFAADVAGNVLAAVTVLVLIRGLPVSTYAYTTLLLTFAQFAGSAAGGGVRLRYLREEAERFSRWGGTAPDPGGAFASSLVKSTVLVAVVGACALPVAVATGIGTTAGGAPLLVLSAAAFAAGFSAAELAIVHHQARRRFLAAGRVRLVRSAALLAAAALAVLSSDDVVVVSAWLVGSMALVGVVTAVPLLRPALARGGRRLRLALGGEERWLSLYYLTSAGFAYVDVMVAGALLGEEDVASLGASVRYLAVVMAAMPALGAVLRVRTAQVDVVDSPTAQRAMVVAWLRRAVLPTAAVVGAAILLAPVLVPEVDGGRYPGSIAPLQILLLTAASAYVTAPAVNVLMSQRRYALLAGIFGAGLAVNLAGDVAVAPEYGITGIAVVSAACYVAVDAVATALSLRTSTERSAA